MLIYGGNSKPLEGQRWHNAHWLAEVKFKILWLGEKYVLRLFGGLLAEIWLFVCTIYMIEISQFSVTGGLLLGHLGQLSSQGGEIHPGKCGWKSLHPSYLQVTYFYRFCMTQISWKFPFEALLGLTLPNLRSNLWTPGWTWRKTTGWPGSEKPPIWGRLGLTWRWIFIKKRKTHKITKM